MIAARGTSDNALDAACEARDEAQERLYETVPQTIAGTQALLAHLAEMWPDYLEHDDADQFAPLFRTFGRIPSCRAKPGT